VSSAPQNIGASVRQRLLNLSREQREDFQFVLTRFALERLLYRLSTSKHAERFLLKGALLFSVWSQRIHRPTRDLDLEGEGDVDPESMARVFREICQSPSTDGLVFNPESVRATRIRDIHQLPGVRIEFFAHLAGARIPIQVDVGSGDSVIPEPSSVEYPTLLGHPAPRLKAYPQETVIAEKFQAMVLFGIVNTRIKDFYDLWMLARSFDFAGPLVSQAIRATFDRRRTSIPIEPPTALNSEFFGDGGKQKAWKSFLDKNLRSSELGIELPEICSFLEGFLMPPSRAAASGAAFEASWAAPGPWWNRGS
jgi:predicted nucleotidyltransferase component of viral defense system